MMGWTGAADRARRPEGQASRACSPLGWPACLLFRRQEPAGPTVRQSPDTPLSQSRETAYHGPIEGQHSCYPTSAPEAVPSLQA